MTLKACPDCGGDLGRSADKCRCGWRATSYFPKLISPCAYEGCPARAVLREKLPTGWANLCEQHWIDEGTKRAKASNAKRGINTKAQQIEFCKKMLKGLARA
jgi:hypothetical protein